MKTLSIIVTALLVSTSSFASYFMASDVQVESIQNGGTPDTVVTVSYEVPCWASYVDTVKKTVILGSPLNYAADFEIAVGVLLEGNPLATCVGSSREMKEIFLNTSSVEGDFNGIKTIQNML